jgi:hypothetical protein
MCCWWKISLQSRKLLNVHFPVLQSYIVFFLGNWGSYQCNITIIQRFSSSSDSFNSIGFSMHQHCTHSILYGYSPSPRRSVRVPWIHFNKFVNILHNRYCRWGIFLRNFSSMRGTNIRAQRIGWLFLSLSFLRIVYLVCACRYKIRNLSTLYALVPNSCTNSTVDHSILEGLRLHVRQCVL